MPPELSLDFYTYYIPNTSRHTLLIPSIATLFVDKSLPI